MMEPGTNKQVKQLAEVLQEQQEPFVLQVYLSERGCGRKTSLSPMNPSNSLSRSMSSSGQKRLNRITHVSKLLRALYNKVAFIRVGSRGKHCVSREADNRVGEGTSKQVPAPDRSSFDGSATVYTPCSDSTTGKTSTPIQKLQNYRGQKQEESTQAVAGRDIESRVQNDHRHFSPLPAPAPVNKDTSSAGELHSKTGQPDLLQAYPTCPEENESTCRVILPKKISEDFPTPGLEILFHCRKDKSNSTRFSHHLSPNTCSDYLNSKRVLQQTKRLLFDCVKEVIEIHGRKEMCIRNNRVALGPEEIGNLICKKIVVWVNTSADETGIDELLYLEYLDSLEEWEDCINQKMQISLQIGDDITEDICNEVIMEMICNS